MPVNDEAVFQREVERLGQDGVGCQRIGIADASRYHHVMHRCRLLQSSGLQHEVFQRLVVGILVGTRILHLSVNGDGLLFLCLYAGGDEQHILVSEGDVGNSAVEDALNVDRQRLECAVSLHAVHDGMLGEGLFGDALSVFQQRLDAIDVFAYLVHARTEDSTLDLDHV